MVPLPCVFSLFHVDTNTQKRKWRRVEKMRVCTRKRKVGENTLQAEFQLSFHLVCRLKSHCSCEQNEICDRGTLQHTSNLQLETPQAVAYF